MFAVAALAVLLLALSAWLISSRRSVAWTAMAAMFPSGVTVFYAREFLTEALALSLFGLFTLALVLTLKQPHRLAWPVLAGLTIGMLALTKPVFLYVFWLVLLFGAVGLFVRQWSPLVKKSTIVFTLGFGLVVTPWSIRNKVTFDQTDIAGSGYGGDVFSASVARYSITLVPVLSIALGAALVHLADRFSRQKKRLQDG